MKKQVSPALTTGILLLALAVLGVVAWRVFGPEPPPQDTPEARAMAQKIVEGMKSQARQAAGSHAPQASQAASSESK